MDREMLETAFKMTISLGAVLLVFGAAVFLVKKFGTKTGLLMGGKGKKNDRPIEVIATHALAPGKTLYIIQCRGKQILVGATQTNLSNLGDVSPDDLEAAEGEEEEQEEFSSRLQDKIPGAMASFSSSLKEFTRV